MSVSSLIFMILSLVVSWGGFAVFLSIAIHKHSND
ncbi:MAG: MetS family NSS transporter small subunit [Spirochaetales bacterium]